MTKRVRADRPGRWPVASLVIIAAVTVALTGCTAIPAKVTRAQAQALLEGASTIQQLEVPKSSVPAKYYNERVHWESCGVFECGAIQVPRDWGNLSGSSITLALIEHKATGTPVGTLVFDPGGPGGSGVDDVGEDLAGVVDPSIAASYNVVGFDPPGVGYSTAVSCLSTKQLDKYIFAPAAGAIGSSKWIADQEHRSAVMASGCDHRSGSLIENIDVVSVAHDLDLIRSALGQSKLNYLGYSWGTYLGTVYASLYPTKTGRTVLDGVFDPWSSADQGGLGQAVGFEGDLDAYLRACLAGKPDAVGKGSCPFTGSRQVADSDVSAIFADANRDPLAGPIGLKLDGTALSNAVIEALYSPTYWPSLTTMFDQLAVGQTTEAMLFLDARYGLDAKGAAVNNFEVAFVASACIQNGPQFDLAGDRTQLRELDKKAPVLGKYLAYSDLGCSAWHYGPAPIPIPVAAPKAAQLLVIGTTGDPATPYKEAQDLAHQLATAHLVTYHGEGHTAYDKGDACINRTVDDYLLHGTIPRSDPECH